MTVAGVDSIELANSFQFAACAQPANSGSVTASLAIKVPSGAADIPESGTLATNICPGCIPSASAPDSSRSHSPVSTLPDVSSPNTTTPSTPTAPGASAQHPRSLGVITKFDASDPSCAVPVIASEDPVTFNSPAAAPYSPDLSPVPPRTPPDQQASLILSTLPPFIAASPCQGHPSNSSAHALTPLNIPRRNSISRFPRSPAFTHSTQRISRSPMGRPSSLTIPHDTSPGQWVRRDMRRSRLRLGAQANPDTSRSPAPHTRAAAGPAMRRSGSAALQGASRSAIELCMIDGAASGDMDSGAYIGGGGLSASSCGASQRDGRTSLRRADGGSSIQHSVKTSSSVNSALPVSLSLPGAAHTEQRQLLQVGSSCSPMSRGRHGLDVVGSASFHDEHDYTDGPMLVRRGSAFRAAAGATGTASASARKLRPSVSGIEMCSLPGMIDDANWRSFMSGGGASAMAAGGDQEDQGAVENISLCSTQERPLPTHSIGSGAYTYSRRYLRMMSAGQREAKTPLSSPTRPGMPSLNFKQYDFALSRHFTFSDGSRIRMPQA